MAPVIDQTPQPMNQPEPFVADFSRHRRPLPAKQILMAYYFGFASLLESS
jgi:hypothetical protein